MEDVLCKSIQNREYKYLDAIKYGYVTDDNILQYKRYEGRLRSKIGKTEWDLFIGKYIKFYDEDDINSWVLVEVTDLLVSDNFGNAYDALGYELIPGSNKRDVINMYNKLFHYTDEILIDGQTSQMISDVGVVAIGFIVIDLK